MIFDPTLSLHYFQTLPIHFGMVQKIDGLKRRLAYLEKQFDHNPSKVNAERMAEIESDLQLFEDLVLYLKSTLESMRGMFDQIAAQAKDANKTADFLETIVNMKMLYYLEHKENKILLDIIAKLMEDRKSSPEKVITFFDKLRAHSKEYMKHLNDKAPCQNP